MVKKEMPIRFFFIMSCTKKTELGVHYTAKCNELYNQQKIIAVKIWTNEFWNDYEDLPPWRASNTKNYRVQKKIWDV